MLRDLLRLGRQSLVYVLGDVLVQAMALILVPIYTRALSPGEYGLLGIVSTVQKVTATTLGLGLAGAVMRLYFDTDEEKERRRTVGAIWMGWLLALIPMLASLTLLAPSASAVLLEQIPFSPYIPLAIGIATLNALATIPRVLLRAQQKPGWFSFFSIVSFAANTSLIILFVVHRQQGAAGSLRGQFLGSLGVSILYVILMAFSTRWTWNGAMFKSALTFGLPLVPHLLAAWALGFSDRLILERNVPLSEIGLYTLAYQFGLAVNMLVSSINYAWHPLYYERARSPEGRSGLPRLATYYSLAIVSVGLAIALLARPAVRILASADYQPAHRLVPIIVAGYTMQGLYFTQTSAILFTKRTRHLPLITGLAAFINIGLNLLLVPRYGVMAAALNTLVGYSLQFAGAFWLARRLFPLPYEYRRIVLSFGAALACFALGTILRATNAWVETLLHGIWVVIGYPVILFLVGFFTPQELRNARMLGRRALERMRGRGCKNS